jgi:hypothetical protein
MWLPNDIIADVDSVVRIYYIDSTMTKRWNDHRRSGELRLLTGWCWVTKNGDHHRQGFKTQTVCYRDAYYAIIKRSEAPRDQRSRLRIIDNHSNSSSSSSTNRRVA